MTIPFTSSREKIERELVTLGISTERPDFYNNPELIAYVGEVPDILNNYAGFIDCRGYADDYLQNAEQVIRIVAEGLYNELRQDGRQGACIDASGVISQILEKEGVWSYQVSGSMTMSFPKGSNIPKLYN